MSPSVIIDGGPWELETQQSACVSICQITQRWLCTNYWNGKFVFQCELCLLGSLITVTAHLFPVTLTDCVRWHRGVVHCINNTQMSLKKDREREWKQLSALSCCFRCEDIKKHAQSHLRRKVCWLSNQKTFASKTNQHFAAAGSQADDFSTCQIFTALKVIVLYKVWRVVSILFTLPLCYRLALYWIIHSVNSYLPRLVFCLSSSVSLHSEF